MILEKKCFEVYDKYRDTIKRYMELIPCEQKEKVNSATLNIMYAIQDISNQLAEYLPKSPALSIYYQIMIKTDFLIGAVEMLFEHFLGDKRDIVWGDNLEKIKRFRFYRSLTLAHPLETTRYREFGFDKENNKWCEEVRPNNRVFLLKDERLKNADYFIIIKEKGIDYTDKIPISIKDDILKIVLIAIDRLDALTINIIDRVSDEIERLKSTPVEAEKHTDITGYINSLLGDVKKRYPCEIKENLLDALERLEFSFPDAIQERKYQRYKDAIKKSVYNYGESIQNMDLEETNANDNLQELLNPSYSILSDKSDVYQAKYKHSKVSMFLSCSNGSSYETAIQKLMDYSYEGCSVSGVCTDAEWGAIQLFLLKDELTPYFPINCNVSDKELYIQYCTALYYANEEKK